MVLYLVLFLYSYKYSWALCTTAAKILRNSLILSGLLRFLRQDQRRRQWHPTPVLLPGKSHGRRSLVGCSPWGRWGLDMTERLHFNFSLWCIGEGNGNPLQCSCLESPRDGGAWWAAVSGVAQSRTGLKWLSSSRQDQSRSWSRVSNSPLQTQEPSVTLSNNAMNFEVFQFGCWEKALNPALCEPGNDCLHFLGTWFLGLGQSPYMNVLVNNLLNTQKKNLCRSPEFSLSLLGSPHSSPLPWSLSILGPPHLRGRCLLASPVFSLSVPQPGNSLRAASRAIRGLTLLVFHLSGITPSVAWGPVSWKQLFRILCQALWLFRFPI